MGLLVRLVLRLRARGEEVRWRGRAGAGVGNEGKVGGGRGAEIWLPLKIEGIFGLGGFLSRIDGEGEKLGVLRGWREGMSRSETKSPEVVRVVLGSSGVGTRYG